MKRTEHTFSAVPAILTILCVFFVLPTSLASNLSVSYELLDHAGGSTHNRLNVAVPESLLDYYVAKDHRMNTETDFAKFVTPNTLKPIADSLWEIYPDDVAFVNGVLMITHQIPYEVTTSPKYPVETMVINKGDCDLFSYIAASIMKAAGLNVVLFYYKQEAHMNIGVSLSQPPEDVRGQVTYLTYHDVRYYVAETTGGNWEDGWRVGENPADLAGADVQIIALEGSEQAGTGQVSASYKTLKSSTLTMDVSTLFLVQGSAITLGGRLSPALSEQNITIYVKPSNSPWRVLEAIATDSGGYYRYVWRIDMAGVCQLRANWAGNDEYCATDSPVYSLTSISWFFLMLIVLAVALSAVGAVVYVASKRHTTRAFEPQPPDIPSI